MEYNIEFTLFESNPRFKIHNLIKIKFIGFSRVGSKKGKNNYMMAYILGLGLRQYIDFSLDFSKSPRNGRLDLEPKDKANFHHEKGKFSFVLDFINCFTSMANSYYSNAKCLSTFFSLSLLWLLLAKLQPSSKSLS